EGHQRLTAEHLLKVIIDDREGLAANLIRSAGGDPARAKTRVEEELARLPKVSGSGAGQLSLDPGLARAFTQAETLAEKAGDSFVTVERLLLAIAMDKANGAGKALADAGVTPQALNAAIEQL